MEAKIYSIHEADLIRGCVRQERAAQKRLYDLYSPLMYPLCCRYLKDHVEAEDVLVIAFTRILQKIETFRNEGSLEGWIKRITINEALSALRRRKSMIVETGLEEIETQAQYYQSSDPLEAEDLLQLIRELPVGYRTVFNLYAIDGFSHKEIAEQLNISENTSKSQLSRARTYLQKLLATHETPLNKNQHDHITR
jgi:RNA polymerase sigma-70 factor (ECF subfamily)